MRAAADDPGQLAQADRLLLGAPDGYASLACGLAAREVSMRRRKGGKRGWKGRVFGPAIGFLGAVHLGACPAPVYGPPPVPTCTTDEDCTRQLGAGWYCGHSDGGAPTTADGAAAGVCEPSPADGGAPEDGGTADGGS